MSDPIYYSNGSIRVTDQEIVLPKRTYPLKDVTSVDLHIVRPGVGTLLKYQFWYYWGLFYLIKNSSTAPDPWRFNLTSDSGSPGVDVGIGYLFLFLILAVKAYQLYKAFLQRTQPIYTANISGKRGTTTVVASLRMESIQMAIDDVNAAINGDSRIKEELRIEEASNPDVVTYLDDSSGQVHRFLWIDGQVYKPDYIKSVENEMVPAHPLAVPTILIAEVMVMLVALALMFTKAVPTDDWFMALIAILVIGLPFFGLTFLMTRLNWPEVHLAKLKTTKGQEYAFASIDATRVQNVVDTIAISLPYGPNSGYITDSEVQVDDMHARFGKKTFVIKDINNVDIRVIREKSQKQAAISVALLITSVALLSFGYSFAEQGGYLAMGLGGILLLPCVGLLIMSNRTTYTLTLEGHFGEVDVYTTHSESYARKIATALRRALMQRGEVIGVGHS